MPREAEKREEFAPEFWRDEDGNTIARVPEAPGVCGDGRTEGEALRSLVRALAFTVWAES